MSSGVVPFNDMRRSFEEQEAEISRAVRRVLCSGQYVHGPEHDAFEREFAAFLAVPHVLGVASGTDALALAVAAVANRHGGTVITAANAGGYSATAVLQAGCRPLYADVDASTLCLDASAVEASIADDTIAVIVTHLYGRIADVEGIAAVCRRRGIAVIEDCAQATGALWRGRMAGTLGDVGAFSFYPTKNLGALGDGGAVVTADDELAERLRKLRQYGWGEKYVVDIPGGRNSRLDELQAAVLRVRLPRVTGWNARRRTIIARYVAAAPTLRIRVLAAEGPHHAGHLAVGLASDRMHVRPRLERMGVATAIHYPVPDHRQPVLHDGRPADLPATEAACEQVLSLPCFPQLTDHEVDLVCEALHAL